MASLRLFNIHYHVVSVRLLTNREYVASLRLLTRHEYVASLRLSTSQECVAFLCLSTNLVCVASPCLFTSLEYSPLFSHLHVKCIVPVTIPRSTFKNRWFSVIPQTIYALYCAHAYLP